MKSVGNPYVRFPSPTVIAHRGGGGLAPENSLLAFDQAVAMDGVHALEMDIHLSRDGKLIVAHDDDVDRMTNGTGLIREMTAAEVRQLDAGYHWTDDNGMTFPFRGHGHYLPTMDEIFERYPNHIINVDIKQHDQATVDAFVALIKRHNVQDRMVVGSFDTKTVGRFRTMLPEVATCASYWEVLSFFLLNKIGLSQFWRGSCVAFQISEFDDSGRLRVISERFVRNLKVHNVQLYVWTVNDSAEMSRLLDWGVDGIITDYPDRLLEVIGNK